MIFDSWIREIGLDATYISSEIKISSFRHSRESGNLVVNSAISKYGFPLSRE